MRPLAVTMGDPASISGEILRGAFEALRADGPEFVLYGDPDWAAAAGLPVAEWSAGARFGEVLPVMPVRLACPARAGTPDATNAPAVIEAIARATRAALAGEVSGVVTNPISKIVLSRAGFAHPGHTEFLAELCGTPDDAVMMLVSPLLRVVPVTIHVSLRTALDRLDEAAIGRAARAADRALRRDFGIASPRLAVAGLNPHAGEEGRMGEEERTMIAPAIARLRAEGIDASGPWPPDTMFTEAARSRYDVAICHYHDQALIPIKTLDVSRGVNVTIGLEVIRTSPDHGTAFDIAGRGIADPSSLIEAIRLAGRLAAVREAQAGGAAG